MEGNNVVLRVKEYMLAKWNGLSSEERLYLTGSLLLFIGYIQLERKQTPLTGFWLAGGLLITIAAFLEVKFLIQHHWTTTSLMISALFGGLIWNVAKANAANLIANLTQGVDYHLTEFAHLFISAILTIWWALLLLPALSLVFLLFYILYFIYNLLEIFQIPRLIEGIFSLSLPQLNQNFSFLRSMGHLALLIFLFQAPLRILQFYPETTPSDIYVSIIVTMDYRSQIPGCDNFSPEAEERALALDEDYNLISVYIPSKHSFEIRPCKK